MSAVVSVMGSHVLTHRGVAHFNVPPPVWSSGAVDGPVPGMTITRASNGTYYNSLGSVVVASSNVARIDFDPVTRVPRGLLVEESRTNYLLNSGTPSNQTVSLSVGSYTLWLEGTGSCMCAAGTAVGTNFGAVTAGSPRVFTVTTAGTVTFTIGGTVIRYQCENGTFATSYIAVTGAAATRAADVCTVGLGSWFDANAFTVSVDFVKSVHDTTHNYGALYLHDGTNNNMTSVYVDRITSVVTFSVANAGGAEISLGLNIVDLGRVNRSCAAYAPNDGRAGYNGNLTTQDTSVNPPALTQMSLGNRPDGTRALNGWVKNIAIYPGRLPDGLLMAVSNQF